MEKSDLQRFRNECVAAHNFYRAAHGTPPLCWSSRLAESAQNWAQQLASSGSPRYSSEKDIGENFVCLWGSELNGQKVTRIWYEEGKYFDHNKPRVSSRTRSFCQVVWEGTREFGAGAAVTKYGKQIVVARYFPPANKKDVARNVKKARSTQDNEQPLAYDTRWSRLYLGLKEFHEECLSVHNEYRLRHGAAPLHWSAELAWEAQQWAENLARSGELRHNDDDTVGENLAGMMGGELTGRETTDMWYDEIEDYDFDNAGYSEDTSNFTQVVWVASESLGVGRAIDGDLCVVVAFYEPPGNMEGSFADNVLRMGSAVRERKSKELKGFVPPPPDLESFRLECLVTHNYFRARHGSPPLVLSSVLTDEAQYWAERLLVTGAMEGLDNSRIGISVAVLDKAHISGIKVSELWYKEILNYDFDSPGFSNETLDFSQLVWLSSRKLGVGKATGAEGVTVVVARYEPVGNIDGLFVQNVRRRGHERGSCEPMIFHVEYRYRVRADSKSTNSFLSWENEDTQTFCELEGDTTRRSDLDQFDENENIVHRADEQESANTLTVSDHFTRLVWIDPNSPTLQRKGVAEETTQEEDDDEPEDEREEEEEEEDTRTAYEMDNATGEDDLTCVTEEPLIHTEEAELEEADLFSDPEDDLYQHICEIRRSLSLDSDGTEPEMHKGNVLSKIAFFETFQQGRQSPSNSESSLRRSLIQEELEELASLKKRQSLHKEEEGEEEEIMGEEHECQLEFDDVFPAHREGDEEEAHVEIFDDEGEDEDESLVSVSDAEDVLDVTDYDTRHEGLQDYEFEDSVCVTHEFMEEEPSAMEIFDFSDEDASHQYADITEEEDQPLSSTKTVHMSTKLSTATEFKKTEPFKLCEDEPPDLMEDAPDNYSEERFETSEAVIELPQASFQRTLDPEFCYLAAKQDHINIRMKDLISKMGLSPVEESEGASDELADFHDTTEGKLLENLFNSRNGREQQYERTPIEEICEAFLKDNVESEIDFEALFKKLENGETETEKANTIHDTSMELLETTESLETIQVVLRDHESERTAGMEQIGVDIGLVSTSALEEEQESEPDISLDYECKTSTPVDLVEPVRETTIESVRRDRPPESTMELKELQVWVESSTEKEKSQEEITQDKSDALREEQSCEAVLRNYDEERAKVLEETGLELNLVPISSHITHSFDEPVEPLQYNHGPKSPTVIELPEISEDIEAEVRRDVRCEINFEEMFRRLEEEDTTFADEAAETRRLAEAITEATPKEEASRASSYVEENWTVDEVVHCIPSSSEYISHESRQREPSEEIIEVKQAEQRRPASLYVDENAAVEDIATETLSSPKHIVGEGASLERIEVVSEVKETLEEKRASLFAEEDSIANEVVRDTPSLHKHFAGESRSVETFEEIHEEASEESYRASVFFEEDTLIGEVGTDTPSSPKHIAGESQQAEFFDEIKEEPIEESKRASLFFEVEPLVDEVTTDTPSSPKHIAGESPQAVSFDEINEEPIEESKRASLFFEVEPLVDEVTTDTPSSPKHIAGEGRQAVSFDEINEELIEKSKRASLFFEVEPLVDEVTTATPSSPKHIAGESRQAESFDEINEESIEESKRASLFFEVEPLVDEVTTDTPSSPKHIVGESRQAESFDEINEEPIEESKRASLFFEVEPLVDEMITDTPSSPKHIVGESQQAESFDEINEEPIEESKRASLFFEVEPLVDEFETDTPSSPKHIAGESRNADSFEEIYEESIEEIKRASLFLEEDADVVEVETDTPSSPKHIAGETQHAKSFDEIKEEPIEESKRASLFFEVEPLVDEVTTDTPSSPKHIAGESCNNAESLEEICEEPFEESERALLFLEEDTDVVEVETGAPSSPKHIAGESRNVESFEEVDQEPTEESKRASLFLEEDSIVDEIETKTPSSLKHIAGERLNVESFEEVNEEPSEESKRASLYVEGGRDVVEVETDTPASPKHIAGESRNIESFEEVEEEPSEESKRASLFIEEDTLIDELISDIPSSPKHLAGESVSVESFEEVAEVTSDENKRASLFVEEDSSVDEVTITTPSVPIHIAGEAFNISSVEEIHEEATPDVEHARELEETYDEARYDYVSLDVVDQNDYVAGEFTSSELLEVTADDESPESDYGEQFEEFESICGTPRFIDPSQRAHIAGEIKNSDTHDEALEEVLQVEESLAYEESQEMVTTTEVLKTSQPSFHVAGELSNIEPQEESSEEEKPDEGACAEEIEETEVQATTVVLKSPQSLLSIAAAALELKIDSAQQETTEVVETKTEIVQQYSEQEQTEVPVIFVNVAGEISDNEEDNAYYVEEEPQDHQEIETERYEDNEETVVSCPTEDRAVSRSHVAAEFCEPEFTPEIEDVEERREFAEPFEESEEGSASELMSECSSSPLHVSSEFRDFQDYETINEEYGTETYHAIAYEESDYVSEKSVSKGLPSLYITEELSPQEIYEENVLNEKSVVIETAQAYNEVEEPLETETSWVISEPPLQTAAEFSDSDYHGGAEEDDDLSERDFLEEFEEMEDVFGREIPLESPKEPAPVVSENFRSGPQIAEEEDELLDETDNAQLLAAQEPLVGIEHYTRTVEQERSVLKEEKIQEEVWEIEVKEGSRVFEPNEEKGFASEIQKFTVVSEKEQRSVEIKSTGYHVVESKETQHGEQIFMGEKARHIETSYEFEQKVEVLATETTRQISSTTSYVATGIASEEIHYKAEKNGGEEVKKIQEVSFTPVHQSSKQTSWEKRENGSQFETTDELSESILEKEAKDQESEKFEKQLSEDETEVRLLKSEVMEYKAAEQQAPLENPHVTVERETTFVKSFIVHSAAKDAQEIQQVVTQDDVLVILKDDEASLEEESAGEQFEEEIDIMRMDEALSEEEFRGEGVESIDRSQSRSPKAEPVDAIDKSDREEESDIYEGGQQEPLYEEEVEISEVRPLHEEALKESSVEEVNQRDGEEESDVREGYQQEPLFEEEVEISEVQPIYEEELEMQKVQEQVETSPETTNITVQSPTYEEEVEVSAYERSDELVKENLEREPVESTELRTHSPEFEEELEVSAFQEVQEEPAEKNEPGAVSAVFEGEADISASREPDRQDVLSKDQERKTTDDIGISEQCVDDESTGHVETMTRRQPLDLSQVDLYEDDESATTRYYVELSSTESLEPAYEEVEDEATYTETYVRQGDPLEENLEEFILVRYSDEFESSGEEDISDHREIYVIPEEENDVENNNVVESARDDLKAEKEPVPESCFEEGFENMGLEEIRESPEFEIDDSPEDELDEEEQRQLEEYERLESFVILEEKLSQVESDEDCDDENAGFQGEEGDENVFHSDVHSSSEETLHEDELGETMTSSSIRHAAVSSEAQAKQEEKADYQISSEHQEHSEDSPSREEEEITTQESFTESTVEVTSSEKGDKGDTSLSKEPPERDVSESSKTKDEKAEQSLSSDSAGEQGISSEGSLSSTPSVDLEGLDDFEQNCLLEHNLYRRQHRVKPLKWSDELAADAKEWAEHMASVNCLERCDGKEVGQNLVSAHGKDLSGSEVVEMWYKEATDYNFEVPAYNAKCGNFTQVVWASSREFGVAKRVAEDGTQYVAALYKPAGNIVGEFKDNVKAPRDSSGRLKRRRSSARRRSRSGLPPVTPAEREKFKTECVISHNYYRTFHNAPPLRWSPLLAAEAQNYAERLVKTNSLTHSGQKDRGENLAYTWDSSLSARGAVDMWYDEVQDYDFECPGYTSDTSHFTQLVWVGTEEFGMGMAVAPDGRNVVVGRYFPPGNIVGQFKENVRPREIAGIP